MSADSNESLGEGLIREGLFAVEDLPPLVIPEPKIKTLLHPIWTEHKAKLIERYLLYFVFITKHGTYIDGFAGPQKSNNPEMWAANLVLANEPMWFRHFYLFDQSASQCKKLNQLKESQPKVDSKGRAVKREIEIFQGDFNVSIDDLLASNRISEKEATFCLLDQRTFECQWASVEKLARYKSPGSNKIELFYFLPIGWLQRALAAQQDKSKLELWWGRDDYEKFRGMSPIDVVHTFIRRFKDELGYKSVKPWPIFENKGNKRIMYFMIHATDHPEAPGLMARAYNKAIQPKETPEQLKMEFGADTEGLEEK